MENREEKTKRSPKTNILIAVLVILFVIVSFYVFEVHIPYLSHQSEQTSIKDELVKAQHYTYDGYFYTYNGESTYYIMRIKNHNKAQYVAYNEKKKLVKTYSGVVTSSTNVKNAIYKKYKLKVKQVNVCYEDGAFMYFAKYQNNSHLYYFYYSLDSATFIKSYNL